MKQIPQSISQTFTVKHEYKLYFTENLFANTNNLLLEIISNYRDSRVKVLFVIDSGVYSKNQKLLEQIKNYCEHHKKHIEYNDTIIVPGGEESKNDHTNVDKILKAINTKHICRHSFVIAIGGGAVIDMAGYAAATAHRGVKLIRVPTTVLAQNDAAVGVKNSINEFGKKNFLGTFAPPYAIINDIEFLKTLEQRDWLSGISEAVKVALIKDADFYNFLDKNAEAFAAREMLPMSKLIYRCAEIHMQHIAQGGDPFENGSSRPLDFGHWAAHKLEQMTNYAIRHGEAVAMGIVLDVTYSKLLGLINQETLNNIRSLFKRTNLDITLPIKEEKEVEELLKGIEEFREHLGGKLTITLIPSIGKKVDVHEIDYDKMREAIALCSSY